MFPLVDARTLQGADKRLPADLPAARTLVVLAFHQRHQANVDAWIDRAAAAGLATDLTQPGDSVPATAVIEVPCISRRWGPVRRFIDGGMTAGIRVPTVLARTWTTYTDVGRVQAALGIPNSDLVWAGVVSRDGDVLAHALGDVGDGNWAVIAQALGTAQE